VLPAALAPDLLPLFLCFEDRPMVQSEMPGAICRADFTCRAASQSVQRVVVCALNKTNRLCSCVLTDCMCWLAGLLHRIVSL
jgi:hypothetical protein